MKPIGFMALSLLFVSGLNRTLLGQQIPVVPYPQEVQFGRGHFSGSGENISLRLSGLNGKSAELITEQLSVAVSEKYGAELQEVESGRPILWVGLPSADEELMAQARKLKLVPDATLGDEGYLLKVEKKNIYILANAPAGAFYGVQTLKQMLRGYGAGKELPAEPEQVEGCPTQP